MKSIFTLVLLFLISTGSMTAQILYSEPFTSSLGTATASGGSNGNWIWSNSCSNSNLTGHTAPGTALFSGSSCQFGNSSFVVSGDLSTPSIPIGPSGAVLTFKYFLSNECGNSNSTCFYDVLTLQISNNGGSTWTNIMASSGTPAGLTNTPAWTSVSYNLNTYSNQSIIVRFNFNSIDGAVNAYDGVYVDDIIVTGNCFINLTALPGNTTVTPVICAGTTLTLTTNAVSNYSWSTGATTPSIVITPSNNTAYSVIATSSANCVSSASLNVVVNNGLPTLTVVNTASANSGTCPNASVMLTASGANTYSWTSSSTQPVTNGIAFSPTTTSGYTVAGTNACGTTTSALSLSVHPAPTVSGVASQPTICSGSPVTLTGLGNAASYAWDGNLSNGATIFPSSTAVHTVIGTSALSCTASAFVTVTVVTTPVAQPISNPPLICIGSSATLSSTGATNYTWTTPTGPVNTSSFVVSPTSTTNYTLTKSNSNCVNIQTVTVLVNPLPTVFAIATPTIICASTQATLSGGGAQSYTWNAGGVPAFTVTGASPVVSPSITTLYTVSASDGTCVNVTTVLLSTNPNPTVGISSTASTVCNGEPVTITANGAIGYTWTTLGMTSNTNAVSVTETPSISTLYQVVGQNSFNCTSAANQVVVVNPTPTLNVTSNKYLVCTGAPANLTVTGANSYLWDANANNATTPVVQVNPVTSTVYTATGYFSGTNCSSTKTVLVSVFLPTFAVNSPTSSCLGGNINLIASGANTYTWNGNQPFSQINVAPTTPTMYVVAATSSSSNINCVSTNTVIVSIYQNPTITAVAQRTMICRGESTTLTGSGAVTYLWNGTPGTTISVSPTSNTTYFVNGTDQNGCVGTTTVQVKTSTCFGINELSSGIAGLSVFPNPNNGVFTIQSESDLTLKLSNELGQLIQTIELNGLNNHSQTVNDLATGLYFISTELNGTKAVEKIVISK